MKRRVVVTGLGAVTPVGNTVEEFWSSVREGKVGIGPITKFDTSEYKVKLAAEVKGFSAKERMDFKAAAVSYVVLILIIILTIVQKGMTGEKK